MSISKDLQQILAEEQILILSGNFQGLEELVQRKTAIARRLATDGLELPIDTCIELSRKAAHNDALLKSAKRGLKAAAAHLKQLSNDEDQKIYSKEGTRSSLASRCNSVVQKI